MKHWRTAVWVLLICCGIVLDAQETPPRAKLFSSDLVAWTFMQQPQQPEKQPGHQPATPDPTPETQPPQIPSPSEQPASASSPSQDSADDPRLQTFTGTIGKQAGNFVLQASASTYYKLDNQEQVQQYLGQRVRVMGRLDRSINLIHVDRIEPLS
jgi:Protein of unknown function (DUF5818)